MGLMCDRIKRGVGIIDKKETIPLEGQARRNKSDKRFDRPKNKEALFHRGEGANVGSIVDGGVQKKKNQRSLQGEEDSPSRADEERNLHEKNQRAQ